jgi:hypothetical protein
VSDAALALFLYRRPLHTRRVVEALRANRLAQASDLYVFCDGPRNTEEAHDVRAVQEYAAGIDGFRSVVLRRHDRNQGLARSVIAGVSAVLAAHRRVVVVEDDVVTAPLALDYFNAMLEHFESSPAVSSISGFAHPPATLPLPADYAYDVFFTPRIKCWGWATWRDRWSHMDWTLDRVRAFLWSPRAVARFRRGGDDLPALLRMQQQGRIDSWAIRWDYRQFRRGTVSVHPRESYVSCIGLDGSGVHCGVGAAAAEVPASGPDRWRLPTEVSLDPRIVAAYRSLYPPPPARLRRAARAALRFMGRGRGRPRPTARSPVA